MAMLGDLWDQIGRFKEVGVRDEFALALFPDLEDRLVAMGAVVIVKVRMDQGSI